LSILIEVKFIHRIKAWLDLNT